MYYSVESIMILLYLKIESPEQSPMSHQAQLSANNATVRLPVMATI